VPLTSGRDCLILDGFGEYLANKIDEMLRHYLRSNADVAGINHSARHISICFT